jgi:mRNA-degrading endonuclease RelE of RelBE toxin-antitoxin system
MEYEFDVELEEKIIKLNKKMPDRIKKLKKKVEQIILLNYEEINHFKNLRKPLQEYKRVHIDKSFVLIFKLTREKIIFKDFDHHDKIYEKIF